MTTRSPFYNMLLNMWVMKSVTAESLKTRTPKFISEEEYQMIIVTPQNGVIPVSLKAEE